MPTPFLGFHTLFSDYLLFEEQLDLLALYWSVFESHICRCDIYYNVFEPYRNKLHADRGPCRRHLHITTSLQYVPLANDVYFVDAKGPDKTDPYASGYTYHQIILIVSAVATALCLTFSVWLASVHLSNWVKPMEQKQ